MTDETDYFVIGGGACALAFVDTMLAETKDVTFTIVDERPAPGGHWNDAYPFVRLHQPSSCYGVASRHLGSDRIDSSGFNAGLRELASGVEVTDYFHRHVREVFLPSGRVNFIPLSRAERDGTVTGRLSGETRQFKVRRKVVDATYLNTSIPLTHKRRFEVGEGVTCAPPNDLTRLAPAFKHYCVMGAGKTAIDAVSWLLANGASPDAISWVVPRDPWLFNRAYTQPGLEFFDETIGRLADQYEVMSTAGSVREMCEKMEVLGLWLRLDQDIWPTLFHGATVSEAELEQLRKISNIIRKGRVTRIEKGRLILEKGEVSTAPDTLFVDCTASAIDAGRKIEGPVFSPDLIRLHIIRQFQPVFSGALIGHIEAVVEDEAEKAAMTRICPTTDVVEEWIPMMATSIMNQGVWAADPRIANWLPTCRLDYFGSTMAQISPDDAEKMATLQRLRQNMAPAAMNLMRLARKAA